MGDKVFFDDWLRKIKAVSWDEEFGSPVDWRCDWCGETFVVQPNQDTVGSHALMHAKKHRSG
jgi:hypothetical protein